MNILATTQNAGGKFFNESERFQIVITVFGSLDDPTAKLLRRLVKGTVTLYDRFQQAVDAQDEFLEMALHVAAHGGLACYGMTAIIDTRDSTVNCAYAISRDLPRPQQKI